MVQYINRSSCGRRDIAPECFCHMKSCIIRLPTHRLEKESFVDRLPISIRLYHQQSNVHAECGSLVHPLCMDCDVVDEKDPVLQARKTSANPGDCAI